MRTIFGAALAFVVAGGAFAQDASLPLDLFSGGRVNGAELTARIAKAAQAPLGSRENPVRVSMPEGERGYLKRLHCSNGSAPGFSRQGSFGPGPFGSILDGYDVICAKGEPKRSTIFLDMYHPEHDEMVAPPGFTLASR